MRNPEYYYTSNGSINIEFLMIPSLRFILAQPVNTAQSTLNPDLSNENKRWEEKWVCDVH